jgi:hypothetical protein
MSRVVFFAIDVLFVKALIVEKKQTQTAHAWSNDGPLLITSRCANHIPATQEGSTGDGGPIWAPHNSNQIPDRLGRYRSWLELQLRWRTWYVQEIAWSLSFASMPSRLDA